MNLKIKSNLIITILTLATIMGFLTSVIGTTTANTNPNPENIIYDPETITWTISPTGGDDTENIQWVFDQAVNYPGITVQLTAGNFRINNIEVEGFDGNFKGEGMDLTIIDVYSKVEPKDYGEYIQLTALFKFEEGDICISDLSFDITDPCPAEPWYPNYPTLYPPYNPDLYQYEDLSMIMWFTGEINSKIERVKYTGHEGTFWWPFSAETWNVRYAIGYWGLSPRIIGKQIISNCEFDSVVFGINTWGLTDGEIKIGGKKSAANTFKGGLAGIILRDTVNSKIQISHNYITTDAGCGILVQQFFSPIYWTWPIISSQCLITYNFLDISNLADGVGIVNLPLEPVIEAIVSHNRILLDNAYEGIYTMWVEEEVVISKNDISGSGVGGIGCYYSNNHLISNNGISGTGLWYGIGCWDGKKHMILGNNLENCVDLLFAQIILVQASNCVVVGGSTRTNVLDLGTDNILVGVNNMHGNPPGPEIMEAMEWIRNRMEEELMFNF